MELAGVVIPDSEICKAATTLAEEASDPFLFNHAMRTYVFGELVGSKASQNYDSEVLYLGAILHDLGLTERFAADDRFELDGADAAAEFLRERKLPDHKIDLVWDAIALHATFSIPQRKVPEIALVQVGAGIDVGAVPLELLTPQLIDEVLEALPRLGFKTAMLAAMALVVKKKPQSAMLNLMSDVGERLVLGFERINFCDVVHHAPISES